MHNEMALYVSYRIILMPRSRFAPNLFVMFCSKIGVIQHAISQADRKCCDQPANSKEKRFEPTTRRQNSCPPV